MIHSMFEFQIYEVLYAAFSIRKRKSKYIVTEQWYVLLVKLKNLSFSGL